MLPANQPQSNKELRQMMQALPGYHPCFACMGACPHQESICPHCEASQKGWPKKWWQSFQRAKLAEQRQSDNPDLQGKGWRWDRYRGRFITEGRYRQEGKKLLIFAGVGIGILLLTIICGAMH